VFSAVVLTAFFLTRMTNRRFRRRPGYSAHRTGARVQAMATNSKRSSRHPSSHRRELPTIRMRFVRQVP
jgi:hypothetical protein